MFADYQALVVASYQTKLKNNVLSINLILPTPAHLRDECLSVCQERYLKKDEKLLRDFFEVREDKAGYMLAIKSTDIDRFKPLCKFLKDANVKTSARNIELLAWLIGFDPRPFEIDRDYITLVETVSPVEPKPTTRLTKTSFTPFVFEKNALLGPARGIVDAPKRSSALSYILAALILALLVAGGFYWNWRSGSGGCMIWSADHYQVAPCTQTSNGPEVTVADNYRLTHLKKINKPDTITGRALGQVWYFKSDTGMEYYTAGGAHPVHPERRLRPLTLYMLNKYIRHL